MSKSVVSLNNVSKSYGELRVLNNLSLTIEEGNIVGLLGPNGVGKTTLLEIITGQLSQDSGEVNVLEYDLPSSEKTTYSVTESIKSSIQGRELKLINNNRITLKEDIGILPENQTPSSFLSAREYLHTFGELRGMDKEEIDEQIEEWSKKLQYTQVLDTLCSDLSQGQKQKVMITQAFMHNPEVVFIDEPLANLDPTIRSIMIDYLQEYVEDGTKTIVLSTHHVDDALRICSEIHLLHTGAEYEKIENVEDMTNEEVTRRITDHD